MLFRAAGSAGHLESANIVAVAKVTVMSSNIDSARLGQSGRFFGKRLTVRQSEELMAYLLISP